MHPPRPEVLLVDDCEEIRETLAELLRLCGYDVRTAVHGKDALACLADGCRPSAILLDLRMPVLGGLGFLHAVKDLPHHASTPVLVLSAHGDAHEQALALGARAFLNKPVDIAQLLGVLKRCGAAEDAGEEER